MILGQGCASKKSVNTDYKIQLQERPASRPAVVDGSPKPCPECEKVSGQPMWKFTERDFIKDKEAHAEKDDYIDYLIGIIDDLQN